MRNHIFGVLLHESEEVLNERVQLLLRAPFKSRAESGAKVVRDVTRENESIDQVTNKF